MELEALSQLGKTDLVYGLLVRQSSRQSDCTSPQRFRTHIKLFTHRINFVAILVFFLFLHVRHITFLTVGNTRVGLLSLSYFLLPRGV